MSLKIVKSTDTILTENLTVLIFGQPGAGKSTLGFSTSKPLMLDFDRGAQRSLGRKDSVQITTWADVNGLAADSLKDYDTIIVDTVGRALDVLASANPQVFKNGTITQQGYGVLGTAFKSWLNKLINLKKDIILIAHDKEEKKGDEIISRLDILGNIPKAEIYKSADLIGYCYMEGKSRKLDFNPTEFHIGKNCANIKEQAIPDIKSTPNFMADLLVFTKDAMNAKSDEQIKAETEFNASLELISNCKTPESCTELTIHAQISKSISLKQHLIKHATNLNFIYDKEAKCFIAKPEEKVELKSDQPEDVFGDVA